MSNTLVLLVFRISLKIYLYNFGYFGRCICIKYRYVLNDLLYLIIIIFLSWYSTFAKFEILLPCFLLILQVEASNRLR